MLMITKNGICFNITLQTVTFWITGNKWLFNINVFNLKDCFKIFTPLLYYTPQNFIVLDINFTMDLFQIKITTKY